MLHLPGIQTSRIWLLLHLLSQIWWLLLVGDIENLVIRPLSTGECQHKGHIPDILPKEAAASLSTLPIAILTSPFNCCSVCYSQIQGGIFKIGVCHFFSRKFLVLVLLYTVLTFLHVSLGSFIWHKLPELREIVTTHLFWYFPSSPKSLISFWNLTSSNLLTNSRQHSPTPPSSRHPFSLAFPARSGNCCFPHSHYRETSVSSFCLPGAAQGILMDVEHTFSLL